MKQLKTIVLLVLYTQLATAQWARLSDLNPGIADGVLFRDNAKLAIDSVFYFAGDDGTHGMELWKTTGFEGTTEMVKDIRPGIEGSDCKFFFHINDLLVFVADDGEHGYELWRSDGTEAGTYLLKDLVSGSTNSFTQFNDHFRDQYFTVYNGILIFRGATELWRSDGTEAGTYLIKNLLQPGAGNPYGFVNFQGKVYFGTNSSYGVGRLFETDGTEEGTKIVHPTHYFRVGSNISATDDRMYMIASQNGNGTFGIEPWVSDGTQEGTGILKNINSAPNQSSSGDNSSRFHFRQLDDYVYFSAKDGQTGHELWRSDGTEDGTTLFGDFNPGSASANPGDLTPLENALIFRMRTETNGNELWRTEGTVATTTMVKDINEGPEDGLGYDWKIFKHLDHVYFRGQTEENGIELWRSDGTEIGTEMIMDITPDTFSNPFNFISFGDLFLFTAYHPETGYEWYKFDPNLERLLPMATSDNLLDCPDDNNGMVSVNPVGGLAPYSISWEDPALSGFELTDLSAGVYYFELRDSFGTVLNDSVVVESVPAMDITTYSEPEILNTSLGLANVFVQGGTPEYTYAWNTNPPDSVAEIMVPMGLYSCTITDNNGCQAIAEVFVDGTTSVENNTLSDLINIRPNPSSNGFFEINHSQTIVGFQVYDLSGALIKNKDNINLTSENIDLSIFPNGIYLLTVQLENGQTKTARLVKN